MKKNVIAGALLALGLVSSAQMAHAARQDSGKTPAQAFQGVHVGMGLGMSIMGNTIFCESPYTEIVSGNVTQTDTSKGDFSTIGTFTGGEQAKSYDGTGTLKAAPTDATINKGGFSISDTLSFGPATSSRATQFAVDARLGCDWAVHDNLLLGASARVTYMPGQIEGESNVTADLRQAVFAMTSAKGLTHNCTNGASGGDFTNGLYVANSTGTTATKFTPASFKYGTEGSMSVELQNNWTVDLFLHLGYAFSSTCEAVMKAGLAIGSWNLQGDVEAVFDHDMFWGNSFPANTTLSQSGYTSYIYQLENEVSGITTPVEFDQSTTFYGVVLAPSLHFKLGERVVAFVEGKLSLFPEKTITVDLIDEAAAIDTTLDLTVNNFTGMGVNIGIQYLIGGSK